MKKPKYQILLDRFISEVNRNAPHQLDIKLFYKFVCACHRGSVKKMNLQELERRLKEAEFEKEDIEKWTTKYEIGRDILRVYSGTMTERERLRDEQAHNNLRKSIGMEPIISRRRGRPKNEN